MFSKVISECYGNQRLNIWASVLRPQGPQLLPSRRCKGGGARHTHRRCPAGRVKISVSFLLNLSSKTNLFEMTLISSPRSLPASVNGWIWSLDVSGLPFSLPRVLTSVRCSAGVMVASRKKTTPLSDLRVYQRLILLEEARQNKTLTRAGQEP
jgi:hypothetical protein